MEKLTDLHCKRPEKGEALSGESISEYHQQIPEWQIIERENIPQLERVFRFKNFAQALEFTNKIGAIAEEENHHPLIITEWGRVTINWWTHKIGGLHKNDFIMAAKTDEVFSQ